MSGGLVLSAREGDKIYIGDRMIELGRVFTPLRFQIKIDGPMIQILEVNGVERQEIFPNVFVQAGTGGNFEVVRLMIDAPKRIRILREKVKERLDERNSSGSRP